MARIIQKLMEMSHIQDFLLIPPLPLIIARTIKSKKVMS
jgi:hypothetical protein